jgi:hypothetical protein
VDRRGRLGVGPTDVRVGPWSADEYRDERRAEVVGPAGRSLHQAILEDLIVERVSCKLIELVNGHANDPAALTARLTEADQTWRTGGTRLEAFLAGAEPAASGQDYLAVLQQWTRSTTAGLPDAAAVLFRSLACIQEEDRVRPVIEAIWPDLWGRLKRPGNPPDVDVAAAHLVKRALVHAESHPDPEGPVSYGIHPGVAEVASSAVDHVFRKAVDTELADFWLAQLGVAEVLEIDEIDVPADMTGRLVLRAARSAAPYLLRQHRWGELGRAAESLLVRARDTATAAALLPMLCAAIDAVRGTDLESELTLGRSRARALAVLYSDEAEPEYRQLLDIAVDHQEFNVAAVLAGDLISLYIRRGGMDEALALADKRSDYTRRAGRGPWSQLSDRVQRLHALHLQGGQVLETGLELLKQMAALPTPPGDNDPTPPWTVRETLLSVLVGAAAGEEQWQLALDMNSEIRESKRRRGAPDREQAQTAFNEYGLLVKLDRVVDARELLIVCRQVFEDSNDVRLLGGTLSSANSSAATTVGCSGHRMRMIAGFGVRSDTGRMSWTAS